MGLTSHVSDVPLDDATVRKWLRKRSLPVCIFGEDAHDRRKRLRTVVAKETDRPTSPPAKEENLEKSSTAAAQQTEEFYIEGSQALKQLRFSLAKPSLARAASRLARERNQPGSESEAHEERAVLAARSLQLTYVQVADRRPLSAVALGYEEDGTRVIVTGGWGGNVAVSTGDCSNEHQAILEHSERISSLSIPRFKQDVLLTASADCTACLFLKNDARAKGGMYSLRHRFREHSARVTDAKVHPFRFDVVVTSSFDGTFGLYGDGKLVQKQTTGHTKVYRVNFHVDGSLLGTCGLEGGLRLWDLRSGRAVVSIPNAHERGALGFEFSGNGTVYATCGMDNMVRIWDLRRNMTMKSIAAHRALVSSIRFGGGLTGSELLFSSSYDQTVKCWSASRNWGLVVACTSHNEKVTSLDCSLDCTEVASVCYDKMWRLWTSAGT